ncbi:MAG: Smr/MutS family protein [Paracoccaceae bacterium]
MTKRRLRADELELWRKVTTSAVPLDKRRSFTSDDIDLGSDKPPERSVSLADFEKAPEARKNGGPRQSKSLTRIALAPADMLRMDKKVFSQLKRGKSKPEARIDLHGMTIDQAHPSLSRFILSAHSEGKRLILVITGKGKQKDQDGPIPVRLGVLRQQVPQWLSLPPLSSVVLQVTEAHTRHGGGGAYYVYLRRNR